MLDHNSAHENAKKLADQFVASATSGGQILEAITDDEANVLIRCGNANNPQTYQPQYLRELIGAFLFQQTHVQNAPEYDRLVYPLVMEKIRSKG